MINEEFLNKQLFQISQAQKPQYVDFVNFLANGLLPPD